MIKTIIYKLYVIALMMFVVWAAYFIYPLIYWEVEYVGVDKVIDIKKNDPDLLKMRKIRDYFDEYVKTKSINLGDLEFVEHYEKGHFHHAGQELTEPILNGCDYCHSVIPHQKDKEARAFRNMHGYFIACEACHYLKNIRPRNIEYRWVMTRNGETIARPLALDGEPAQIKNKLAKAKGNYGARITPWIKQNGELVSIVERSSRAGAQWLLEEFDALDKSVVKEELSTMHKGLTKKPLKCDGCHTKKNAAMSYRKLGYTKSAAKKLEDTEVAAVLSKYDKFHFPNLFIRKDDRKRDTEKNGTLGF